MENKQAEKSQAELYREERKERMAKATKKNAKKSPQVAKAGKIVGKVVGIVVVVALCLGILYGCLDFFGVPQKVMTAAKVGETRISVAKYNFYYMDQYLNAYNTAYQYDSQYGSGYGKLYTGYDYTKSPLEQSYTLGTVEGYEDATNVTWADYFKVSALNYVQSYVAYAQLARENGVTVTDDQKSSIEEQITSLTTTAEKNDYSLNRYLVKLYGKGANEKLFRQVLEEQYLAYNYAVSKQQEISDSITTEQVNDEFNNNIQSYTTFSVSLFSVTADTSSLASDATDDEIAAAKSANMAAAKTTADALLAKVSSSATLLSAAQGYNSKLTESTVVYTDTTASSISSSFGSSVIDWVYSSDRVAGDKAVVETDSGYVVVYLASLPARDTSKAVNVRHILVQFETSTDSDGNTIELTAAEKQTYYSKAESIYNEYLANPTEENFASLAETYSDDTGSNTNGGLYEDVNKGEMVTEFNDWIFDAARKSGDTGIIETSYGYHIMYYVNNDNNEAWIASCRSSISNAKFTEFDTSTMQSETYALKKHVKTLSWAAEQMEKTIVKQYINS